MTPITILIGSMTGNAEFAAEDMQQILRDDYGREVDLLLMDKIGPDIFEAGSLFLICTSTYGTGDIPDNGQMLYRGLCERRPDLAGVRYAVFGLGDSSYAETFNFGGKKFDDILTMLGASRLGERARHDARSGVPAEEYAREWIRAWYEGVHAELDRTGPGFDK